jgi:hypothetical protein
MIEHVTTSPIAANPCSAVKGNLIERAREVMETYEATIGINLLRMGAGIFSLVVGGVHILGDVDLAKVTCALDAISAFLGAEDCRKKHGDQNSNDGNYYEQLDEGEANAGTMVWPTHLIPLSVKDAPREGGEECGEKKYSNPSTLLLQFKFSVSRVFRNDSRALVCLLRPSSRSCLFIRHQPELNFTGSKTTGNIGVGACFAGKNRSGLIGCKQYNEIEEQWSVLEFCVVSWRIGGSHFGHGVCAEHLRNSCQN